MRQYHFIRISIICIFCASYFAACTDKYNPSSGYKPSVQDKNICVSPSSIIVPGASATGFFNVTSHNVPWNLENDIPWINIMDNNNFYYTESKRITLGIDANTSFDTQRMGVIYINSIDSVWPWQGAVSVTQETAIPWASCIYNSIEFEGSPSHKELEFQSNIPSRPTISWNAEWLNVSVESKRIIFDVSVNTGEMRSDIVSFYWKTYNVGFTISVHQLPASLTLATDTLHFPNSSSHITLNLEAQTDWYAVSNYSWISVSPRYGTSDSTALTIFVMPNPAIEKRMGSVQVMMYVGNTAIKSVSIPVLQDGCFLHVEDTCSFDVFYDETKISLQVRSNTSWVVQDIPEWIIVSPTSGVGDQEIQFTIQANSTIQDRQCVVDIVHEGTILHTPISIHQQASPFTSDKSMYFPDSASTINHYIDAAANLPWTITTDCTWISFSVLEGVGPMDVGVSVTDNNTYDNERVGFFSICSGDSILNVLVRQQGKFFNIKKDNVSFSSAGGTMDVSISTNDQWSAYLEDGWVDWVSLTEKNNTLQIDVADNPSIHAREAIIIVEAAGGRNLRIHLKQKERELKLSVLDVFFFASGGVTEPIEVITDGTWDVSKDGYWFECSLYNNSFVVEAQPLVYDSSRVGTITVTLTDVIDGTISVTLQVMQLSHGGIFIINGYGPNSNWNPLSDTDNNLQITIIDYGTDNNWN